MAPPLATTSHPRFATSSGQAKRDETSWTSKWGKRREAKLRKAELTQKTLALENGQRAIAELQIGAIAKLTALGLVAALTLAIVAGVFGYYAPKRQP